MTDRAASFTYQGDELTLFASAHNWKHYFADALRPYIGRRVLEVGAGIGGTTQALCTGREESWICLEPDADLVKTLGAKQKNGELPPVCAVRQGVLDDLGLDDRFDTIVYIDVLEHIERDREELAGAAAHLLPGGRLVVLVPAFQWLYTNFDAAIGHFRRYTRSQLVALTPPSLAVKSAFYLDSVGMLASAANRLLLSSGMPSAAQIKLWDGVLVPISLVVDRLIGRNFGRSVVIVWNTT